MLRALQALSLVICCSAFATAQEPTDSTRQAAIDKLVQELGDRSFEVREAADRQLSAMGLAIKRDLLEGMRGPEAEIRWRCVRMWEAVRETDFQTRAAAFINDAEGINNYEFPGWDLYRQVCGTSPATRQTFIGLQRAEPRLWQEFAESPSGDPPRLRDLRQQLQYALQDPQRRAQINGATALSVLFMTTQGGTEISPQEQQSMNELWELAAIVDMVRADSVWAALKSAWFRLEVDDRPAFERLMAELRDKGGNVIPIARELLNGKDVPASQAQYALLALANSKNPSEEALIQSFLNNPTPIDTYFSRGVVIKSQLRDVALASLIFQADKDPKDFGFNYLRPDDNTLFSLSTLGFTDDAEREAAFQKCSQFTMPNVLNAANE